MEVNVTYYTSNSPVQSEHYLAWNTLSQRRKQAARSVLPPSSRSVKCKMCILDPHATVVTKVELISHKPGYDDIMAPIQVSYTSTELLVYTWTAADLFSVGVY